METKAAFRHLKKKQKKQNSGLSFIWIWIICWVALYFHCLLWEHCDKRCNSAQLITFSNCRSHSQICLGLMYTKACEGLGLVGMIFTLVASMHLMFSRSDQIKCSIGIYTISYTLLLLFRIIYTVLLSNWIKCITGCN